MDGSGTCVPAPQTCSTLWEPVCGCDGETYASDCLRLQAGATLDHEGECESKIVCSPDPGQSFCKMMPPSCPENQVPSVENGCWGECVDITECS